MGEGEFYRFIVSEDSFRGSAEDIVIMETKGGSFEAIVTGYGIEEGVRGEVNEEHSAGELDSGVNLIIEHRGG